MLDTCLGTIPNRNSLLIAGDLNCSAEQDGSHVGTSTFTWHGHPCKGPQHRDMKSFHSVLKKYHLTILNGWNAQHGPTFHNGLMVSRIDFFITRTADADGFSRDVKYLTHADIIPLKGATHIPLMCCIRRFHFSYKSRQSTGFTYQQRMRCRLDWQGGSDTWASMMEQTGSALQEICANSDSNGDPVQHFHDQMGQKFHHFYPKNVKVPHAPKPNHEDIIQQKWYYHRQVKQNQSLTLHAIFHVWKCRSKCAQLTREHRRLTKVFKRQKFFDLLTAVQNAADRHDSFEVHQIINRFTPKQPKKKIQLRNEDGSPASPAEALQMTRDFVARIWAGAETINLGPRDPPGVPISIADIEFELQRLPHNKSVASPFLPALVVKQHASTIAPWIHQFLTQWWSHSNPYIPVLWKRAWVTLIPKPNKSPCKVENLRCIALQEPLGKCILGALTRKLLEATGSTLMEWPQFAFLPHRSTGDAIRRVMDHCNTVRCLVKTQRRSAHQRASATEFFSCCGGIQIFLDIQRAFDQLPRQQLLEHLDALHDATALTTLLAQWHTDTSYCVEQAGETVVVETSKGVRQGCRAAPLLWNCFLDQFFRQLAAAVSIDWVKETLTAFADDIHQGAVFKSKHQLLTEISRIGLILDTLENLGLTLSLEKSFILIEIAGTHSRKIRSSLVKQAGGHFFLEIPRANGTHSRIPVKKKADYLGTCLSYSNPEQLTFEKRVQCARITYHRLRSWLRTHAIGLRHRLQLWRACVVSTLTYGLFAVNLTLPIIKNFQLIIFGMYRQLTQNYSFRTHDSHQTILYRYGLEHPLMLLLRHAHQLQCRLGQRSQHLQANDILVHVNWTTLTQNIQMLQVALEVQVPVSPTADNGLEVPQALMYSCTECHYVADTLANLRRHQTVVHQRTQFRSS